MMAKKNSEEVLQLDTNKNCDEKDQEMRKDKNKKNNFQKYAENNTVGGLSYVLSSKSKIRRFIWLIIILVCVAISLYLVRNSFFKMFNPPTSTTTTNDPNLTLQFPAVTICNVNPFSTGKLGTIGIDVEDFRDIEYLKGLDSDDARDQFNITLTELSKVSALGFISDCVLGDYECDIDEDFDFTLKDLYACFTFNSGRKKPIMEATGTGKNRGLNFIVHIDQDDFAASIHRDVGVRIVIHPQNEPPQPDRFGVAASPGTHMHISFKKRIFDDQTRRKCFADDRHRWRHLSERFSSYSYAGCLEDSITDMSISKCGCVLSTDNLSNGQYNVCKLNDLFCYIDNYYVEPLEPCPPACKHTSFEIISATHTLYPIQTAIDANDTEDGTLLVSVFYETLNVQTQTTVYSYGVEEFFAEVGGQLGLFIGVSVITLFEFIIFLLDEIKNRIKPFLKIRRF